LVSRPAALLESAIHKGVRGNVLVGRGGYG
jgi:hypothetical protein